MIAGILGISLPFIVPNVAFNVPAIAAILPPAARRWEGMYLFWAAAGGMPPALMVLLAAALFAAGSTVYLRRLA